MRPFPAARPSAPVVTGTWRMLAPAAMDMAVVATRASIPVAVCLVASLRGYRMRDIRVRFKAGDDHFWQRPFEQLFNVLEQSHFTMCHQ